MSDNNNNNNNNNNLSRKEDIVSHTMNPEDRPDLQNYNMKQQSSNSARTDNQCEYWNSIFSSMEEPTAHFIKEYTE